MEIAHNIHRIDGIKGAHAYLLVGPVPTLIDTGLPGQECRIMDYLARIGLLPQDLKYIVLTHYDLDHVGSALAVREVTGALVCAHELEVPFIEGQSVRPGIKKYLPMLTMPMYGRLKPVPIDLALQDNDKLGDAKVIHTPGHSPGHLCLVYEDCMLVGDLVQGGGREAPGIFIWNRKLARESIQRIQNLGVKLFLPGHGQPVTARELDNLINKWKEHP